MSYSMFKNSIDNCMTDSKPNNWYRNIQQAFIDAQWENTVSIKRVGEQKVVWNQTDYFEKFQFVNMDVWVDSVVGQSSTGSKTGRDFIRIIFKDINHPKLEGRYYIIDGEYYISYFDDRVVDVDANLSVRRCTEWLKVVDPLTGAVYAIPCVVDYDMTAPSNKVTTAIITPNNHASVKVQENATTKRLFTTNTRCIIGGRPFRLTGMQNAVNQFINNPAVGLMELDFFLDEIWDTDDLVNSVADNGTYDYSVDIVGDSMNLTNGATGQLYAHVLLNGDEVDRTVVWSSSDSSAVTIDEDGNYSVVGASGQEVIITACLSGNSEATDTITISIVDEEEATIELVLSPLITTIREYETVAVEVNCLYNGSMVTPDEVTLTLPSGIGSYLTYTQTDNVFYLSCVRRYPDIITLTFEATSASPAFTQQKSIDVKLTNILG